MVTLVGLFKRLAVSVAVALLVYQTPSEAAPYSALVVDLDSERVLYSQAAEELRHPASLTKMMTLYMVFEALHSGELALDTVLTASPYASSKPPSSLGLRPGHNLTVEQAILGVVTQSANDAATTLAEHLGGGSEAAFAEMMTLKARQLGMNGSTFYNASGLPHPNQWTTAWDMYRLGRALQKHFPQYYPYFSTQKFNFRGNSFHNHNHLLETYQGTDGIKTGFVNASGFNLVASARRNGRRLIGVVFGGSSYARRDAHMRDILDDGFAQLEGQNSTIHFSGFEGQDGRSLFNRPSNVARMLRAGGIREYPPQKNGEIPQPRKHAAVLLGTFSLESAASHALVLAKTAPMLAHGKASVTIRTTGKTKKYTASISGLKREDADAGCRLLKSKKQACSVVAQK